MFVQVMEARVGDLDAMKAQMAAWLTDLQPGADGWLGTTAGVTADGTFIGVTRFESEAAAQANSDRPEQGEWWTAFAATLDGEATFTNCPDVDTFGAGGSDEAGFVQIMIGHGDRAAIMPRAAELDAVLRRMRPDVIGGTAAWPGDGSFVQTVYFTSESEARANESAPPMTDAEAAEMEELLALMKVDRYLDLNEPWLYSR